MFRSKGLKKLLCMIIVFSLVLTGSTFSAFAYEQNDNDIILSDDSATEEAIAGLTDENYIIEGDTDLTTEETVAPIDDGEEIYSDDLEIVDEISTGDEDTEHTSESLTPAEDDLSIVDSLEESLTDSSLTDSSLTDSSLTDSSLTDSSLTDSSLVEETLVGASDHIEEGIYLIQSALDTKACIGIAGNSTANQANVELVSKNGGYAQFFYLKRTSDGYYQFINYYTEKAIHIPGGGKTPGANVVQYAQRDLNAQKWSVNYVSGSTYVTIQSVSCGLFLDCAGAKSVPGTNIQLNKKTNNVREEMWRLVPVYGKVAVESRLTDANISKGYYHINIKGHTNLAAHVSGASTAAGASIMLRTLGESYSQAFLILPQGNGLYKIRNVRSEKYFATSNGTGGTTNIVQKSFASGDASQLWYILKDPETGHIVIKPSNAKHAVMTARAVNTGSNILNSAFVNDGTQFWGFRKISVYAKNAQYNPSETVCYISPASATVKTLGVKGGSFNNLADIQITTSSDSNAHKWRVIPNGDGTYSILNVKTGKALDVYGANFVSGTDVNQYMSNGTNAQRWKFRYTGSEDGSIYIVSDDENYVLDIQGGICRNGADICIARKGTAGSQKFLLQKTTVNKKASWVTEANNKRYYYNSLGQLFYGWHKIGGSIYYFFNRTTGVMARNTTVDGFTIDSEGVSNRTDFVTATGARTIRGLLTNAVAPAGRVLYIWGGGHGGIDTSKIGMLPGWTTFYNAHVSSSYNYDGYRWQYGMGLDCSGFVGWTVYNTLFTKDDVMDIDNTSTAIAADYISRGWCYHAEGFKPGDIVSRNGHVWISMGTCSDGSVLIMHSTPQGVQLSGTEGKSLELASKYMTKISKSTGWPFPIKQYGAGYLEYVGKATWKVDGSGILTDPEGLQKKSAEQVCKIIFGY